MIMPVIVVHMSLGKIKIGKELMVKAKMGQILHQEYCSRRKNM